jgi:hypothetical protein
MGSSALLDQGHVRLKQCRHGPMLYLVTDPYVGQSLDCYGEYSEEEVALLRMAYRLYWHLPPLFNPQNYFGVGENMFGRIVSVNMLGLPASVPQEVQGLHEVISLVALFLPFGIDSRILQLMIVLRAVATFAGTLLPCFARTKRRRKPEPPSGGRALCAVARQAEQGLRARGPVRPPWRRTRQDRVQRIQQGPPREELMHLSEPPSGHP